MDLGLSPSQMPRGNRVHVDVINQTTSVWSETINKKHGSNAKESIMDEQKKKEYMQSLANSKTKEEIEVFLIFLCLLVGTAKPQCL